MNICEKCGADLKECSDCDLSNNKIIVIPENATNGDMIKALFPNAKTFEIESDKSGKVISYGIWLDDDQYYFDTSWWNASYKKEE